MSGKNLSFLSKKSWHTGTIRHMDKVWKAEQKHEAEQKKIQELQKELQRERSRKDLLDAKTGGPSNTGKESLEWMYRGVLSSSKTTEQELNQPYIAPDEKEDLTTPSILQRKPVSATQDDWNKVMEDPLLNIKQREQDTLKMIANNPVKMKEIMKALQQKQDSKKSKKKSKSDKKRSRKRSYSPSRSPSPPRKRQRTHSQPEVDDSRARHHRHHRNSPSRRSHHDDYDSRYRDRSPSERKRSRRSRSPPPSRRQRDYDYSSRSSRRSRRSPSPPAQEPSRKYHHNRRNKPTQLTEEERAARIREMAADGKANYDMKVNRYLKSNEERKDPDEDLTARNEDENFIR